jgi:allantoin racemase
MRILIINPNSDSDMTKAINESAVAFASDRFEVVCKPTPGAPKFIETYQDDVAAAPGMLQLVKEHEQEVDAIVVACHGDANIDAIKESTTKPVVGIGEASMKIASMLGHSFSVVTTAKRSIPPKKGQARKYHLQDLMVSVRAPEADASDCEDDQLFVELARLAVEVDLAEVIVLGCAGLTGMDKLIQETLNVPTLDGVVCALMIAEGLVRYGISTSKVLGFNPEWQ